MIPLLDNLFKGSKNKAFLGIELRRTDGKIALLEKKGDRFDIPIVPFDITFPDSIEDAATILKDELAKRDIKNVPVVAGLPPSSLFFKSIKLPKDSKEDIVDAIEYNIREDINTIQGSTYYDYYILSEKGEMLEVLVVIAKLADIERIKDICDLAGLKVNIIDAEPLSLINLASFLLKKEENKDENICIVHLDDKESYLAFFHKNVIVQNLNFSSSRYKDMSPDDRERVVESLVNEINYFFLTIHEPRTIFMSGDSFKFPEIKAYMQLKFGNRFELDDLDPVKALSLDYQGKFILGLYNIPISLALRGFIE